jgi:lipid II:glycine glycyltransferase (peptidoglycan interpeptide bridge formation enzyme)
MGHKLQIRVARKDGAPIAAMLTLRHKSSVVYKYGCSDDRFHNLGGMPFLFWKLVDESKTTGAKFIDLGRTDPYNDGLATFKDRLGANRKLLTYYRYTKVPKPIRRVERSHTIRQLLSILPASLSVTAGRLLYRHMG